MRTPPALRSAACALALAAASTLLAAACSEERDPLEMCEVARSPAFCAPGEEAVCQCTSCVVEEDGRIGCDLSLNQGQAQCRSDGADWQGCSCAPPPTRAVCIEACRTMRCDAGCDDVSAFECGQSCEQMLVAHQALHAEAPSEGCALAIARIATCLEFLGCPSATACEGLATDDDLEALARSECFPGSEAPAQADRGGPDDGL